MRLAITMFLMVVCGLSAAEKPSLRNPYQGDSEAREAGHKLYRRYCAACHGENAQGIGKNPPLNSTHVTKAAPGTLYSLLTNGIVRRGMPAWSNLPPQQRWQIVTYLQSLK
jgi:mono/diheme cytochrome c family protein